MDIKKDNNLLLKNKFDFKYNTKEFNLSTIKHKMNQYTNLTKCLELDQAHQDVIESKKTMIAAYFQAD